MIVPLAEEVAVEGDVLLHVCTHAHYTSAQVVNMLRQVGLDPLPDVMLISLADHLATFGPQPLGGSWERHLGVVHLLLTRDIRERESILPPRLISAEELMRRLRLEPGPQVGQLLELIAEAQAEGRIHSKEEAIWLAEDAMAIARDAPDKDEPPINVERGEE